MVVLVAAWTVHAAPYENDWGIRAGSPGAPPPPIRCIFSISGAPAVSLSAGCADGMTFSASGSQTGPESFFLFGVGTTFVLSVTGSASPSGDSISGVVTTPFGEIPYTGSLCGNGALDGSEECDAGYGPSSSCDLDSCSLLEDPPICNARVCEAGSCTIVPLPSGTSCDRDGESCTIDECDGAGACAMVACSACCDASAGCTPRACKRSLARKTSLSLAVSPAGKERIVWTAAKLEAATSAELGDPTTAGGYHLCVFDQGTARRLRLDAMLPAATSCGSRPCWRSTSKGFVYRSSTGAPDGVTSLRIASSPAGSGTLAVRGKGAALLHGTPESTPPRPFEGSVVVELHNPTTCWATDFGSPGTIVRRSGYGLFVAKGGE